MHICAIRENIAANNISSSRVAMETVVTATEQNHLHIASRPVDSVPTRGVLHLIISDKKYVIYITNV